MGRFVGHVGAAVVLLAVAGAIGEGCVHPNTMLVLRAVQAPSDNCTYSSDRNATSVSKGVLDLGLTASYHAALLVGSQLVSTSEANTPTAETNRIIVNGVSIRVTDVKGAPVGEAFSTVATGTVDPASGGSIGPYEVVQSTLLTKTLANAIGSALGPGETREVVANTRVFGKTLGGLKVESNEYPFPIIVCDGCLVYFPPNDDCTKAPESTQAIPPEVNSSQSKCTPGQDQPVGCWTCHPARPMCVPTTNPWHASPG